MFTRRCWIILSVFSASLSSMSRLWRGRDGGAVEGAAGRLISWREILWRTIYRRLWRLRYGLGLAAAQALPMSRRVPGPVY